MLKRDVAKKFKDKAAAPTYGPLVLDVDTGRDDSWAILGAFDEFEVAAVVSTYGNVPLEKTTRNSLDVSFLAVSHGNSISDSERLMTVWQGTDGPMNPASPAGLAEIARRASINGNGLCNLVIPRSPHTPKSTDATWEQGFLKFLESQSQPVNYLACGPLTNLANLIDAAGINKNGEYLIRKHIKNVIVMGGSFCDEQGVDFNFKADPRAAQRVLRVFKDSVFLFPFDETKKLRLSTQQIESMQANCVPSKFSRDLMLAHARGWSPDGNIMLHDPATLLAFDHRVSNFVPQKVRIKIQGDDAGRTVSDDRGVEIKRFSIPEGQESSTRDLLLNKYLNLQIT